MAADAAVRFTMSGPPYRAGETRVSEFGSQQA
jgi:hypothetical protein